MTGMVNPRVERTIIRGDARRLPLRDACIDLIVTSPPFWQLRDYGVPGQIGNEATRGTFLQHLWEVTAECVRVMKPTASLFVELGDSYSDKSLNLSPQRYAIGCVDKLGLILRAEIIWNRPNGLPESVTDRVRVSHSRWWHLAKQPRYYAALDEIREPYEAKPQRRLTPAPQVPYYRTQGEQAGNLLRSRLWDEPKAGDNPLGKLPGSVWSIPSEPLRLPPWIDTDHYAAFPTEWPRRLILAFSPPGICRACGQGRFPVVERRRGFTNGRCDGCGAERSKHHQSAKSGMWESAERFSGRPTTVLEDGCMPCQAATILGYACGCTPHTDHPGTGESQWAQDERTDGRLAGLRAEGASRRPAMNELHNYQRVGPWREYHLDRWTPPPTRPAIVLDPFSGTGTVPHVARALGRIGVGIDLSEPYSRLAADQTLARQRAAKVLGRVNIERQGTLL
jgi:DNA modification methylase